MAAKTKRPAESAASLFRSAEQELLALAHARRLVSQGADIIELGAASSNPDAAYVGAGEEIARLRPVLDELRSERRVLSVDTTKPEVQQFALEHGTMVAKLVRPAAVPITVPNTSPMLQPVRQ